MPRHGREGVKRTTNVYMWGLFYFVPIFAFLFLIVTW